MGRDLPQIIFSTMSEEQNFEGQETTPEVPETSNEASLEVNDTDHGNDSQAEGDASESSSQRRSDRAEFFKRKEELEKEYQEKLSDLESRKGDYQEGEEGGQRVTSNDTLARMQMELAEVTLKQEGITHQDDIEQLLEISDKMGKTPKEVASLTWVQAMLKDNAQVRRNTAATPSSTNRSGQKSAKDSLAYWMNRTDLPAKENKELRRQVIHARANAHNKSQMFNN